MRKMDNPPHMPVGNAIGVRFAVIGTILVLIGAEPMALAVIVVAMGYEMWRRAL